MWKNVYDWIVAALCGSVAVAVRQAPFVDGAGWMVSVAAPAAGSVLLYALLQAAVPYILMDGWIRRRWKPEAVTEGEWLEEFVFDGVQLYGLFRIYYDVKSGYQVEGTTFLRDGLLCANWSSDDVDFNEHDNVMHFLYRASNLDGENIRGFTRYSFSMNSDHATDDGIGYFVDMGSTAQSCTHTFKRLHPRLMEETLGEAKTELRGDDRIAFVKKYHLAKQGAGETASGA